MAEDTLPHLLLYGPPGTGKTSTILALARELYGDKMKSMTLELNASDDRGIDVVRRQIVDFASTKTIFSSGFKLIVLDESDSMTQPAQAALRRVMEKYTRNVRFCLVCNYVSKIIPALQSRCTRFRFAPLAVEQMNLRLDHVVAAERFAAGKDMVLKLAKGDMRRVLNILQSTHAAFDLVDDHAVISCTGQPHPNDVESIVTWMLEKDFATAYSHVAALQIEKGIALQDIITEVYGLIQKFEFPREMRCFVLDEMAKIEYRLTSGCVEKMQLGALVSCFALGKELSAK